MQVKTDSSSEQKGRHASKPFSLLTLKRGTKQHLNWTVQHISLSSFTRAVPSMPVQAGTCLLSACDCARDFPQSLAPMPRLTLLILPWQWLKIPAWCTVALTLFTATILVDQATSDFLLYSSLQKTKLQRKKKKKNETKLPTTHSNTT